MAKKKKNQNTQPVELSKEELIPSVIGVINEKEKSNWPLVIIFIILIGFIIGLPTITSYLNADDREEENISSNNNQKDNKDDTPTEDISFYRFSDTKSVNVEGISFQEFNLGEKTIQLSITNNSEAKNYLLTHKLYLELYNKDNMLLQRIKLPTENLNKGVTQNYTFDLVVSKSQIAQFMIDEKEEKDYPSVDLEKADDDTYLLTCTKNYEKLTYQFNADQKLTMITDVFNYSSSMSDYTKSLSDYRQMSSKYNAIEGVISNIVEVATGFTVTTNLDLSKVDMNDRVVQNTLDNVAYYGEDTEGKVIYFELSAMNYICNR